jgi:choline dehydrogenase-like flavoprotein
MEVNLIVFLQIDSKHFRKTVPQNHLKGQQIDYSRGKGLGGSTAINFSCWVIGADEDYNEVG